MPTIKFTVTVCGTMDWRYLAVGISCRSLRDPGMYSKLGTPSESDGMVISLSSKLPWVDTSDKSVVSWMENEWS
jgi:hypothetical protein